MATIEEKRRLRERVLLELYRLTDGNQQAMVEVSGIANALDEPVDAVEAAAQWLADHGFAKFPVMAPVLSITAAGVDEAERLLEEQEAIEKPEPQRIDVPIDGSAPDATPVLQVIEPEQGALLERMIRDLGLILDSGEDGLGKQDEADARVQLDTIATQLRSPKPRAGVIGTALKALQVVGGATMAGVLGNAAYAGVVEVLTRLG